MLKELRSQIQQLELLQEPDQEFVSKSDYNWVKGERAGRKDLDNLKFVIAPRQAFSWAQ